MDLNSLPACAMYRSVGTVIVRNWMEVKDRARGQARPAGPLPSTCERCNRISLVTKHNSDCDSAVERCRPYRASAARSRYVNVSAAVCLLLLVGGLSPQSSAAPHRSMHRQKRATTGENGLWANPCDYKDPKASSTSPTAAKELAFNLVAQAKNSLASAAKYKDVFALKLHSYPKFEDLLAVWESEEWLRKFSWYREEVLPRQKVLNTPMSDQYVNELMGKMNDVMPAMYKGLKMVVAGLYSFSKDGLNEIISDESLKENINKTMHDVRAVLCHFSEILKARNLEIMPLPDSDIPDFQSENKLSTGVLLYRDTLNYLEYLVQVFQKFVDTESA